MKGSLRATLARLLPRALARPALLGALALVYGVPSGTRAQQFTYASYGASSGLTNLNVQSMLEDHSGRIWVGTESGVFTADGDRFEKQAAFSAAGLENVRALREDSAHRIWAVDGRHLAYWQDGAVHAVAGLTMRVLMHEPLAIEVLPGVANRVYLLRAGELWEASSAGGNHDWTARPTLLAGVVRDYPDLSRISSLVGEGSSTLWAGCGTSLCRINPREQAVTRFGPEQGVPADTWRYLLSTRDGSLWARGDHHLIVRAPGAAGFSEPAHQPAAATEPMRTPMLIEDRSGKVLLNTGTGIARGDQQGWQSYTHSNGLPEDSVDTLMFDHAGQLWFSSLGHGLMRWYGYGDWQGWTRAEGLNNNIIWSLARASASQLWVATDKGLNRLDPSDPAATGLIDKRNNDRVLAVVTDARGHAWIANATGQLVDYDPATGRRHTAVDQLQRIFRLYVDRQQRLWVCSRKGLFYFSADNLWTAPHPVTELPAGYAWDVTQGSDGTLWVSTGTGLYRLRDGRWSAIRLPFPGGTAYNFMLAAAPDGTLWVQSKSPTPMLHLKVEGERALILERVDGSQFGSDNITFVEMDLRGWLWVGSDDGLHVWNGRRWVQASAEDGLIWDDTDFHAFLADPDGSIWVGTSAGVSHLLHPEKLFTVPAPSVRVTSAVVGRTELAEGASATLNLTRPTLTVRLLDINYARGPATVTRYRLEGEENDWQDATSSTVRFPSLYPGHYKLQVLTYDRRLHLSSPVVSFGFTLLEPWWKRPKFFILEMLALVALLLCIWRLSVRLLVARQQELERLVRERTEELEAEKRELLAARSELLETTRRDPLTGLLNRRAIFEHMQTLSRSARTLGHPVAIIMADLDNFKRVNDECGHMVGDLVLQECARRISSVTRPVDFVGRYGGEELLILMPGLDRRSVAKRMEEVRLAIASDPVVYADGHLDITCSFGVAWFDGGDLPVETLVALADSALYAAKRNGRNRVEYATEDNGLVESLTSC